jgi:hypothetical protein
MGCHTGPNLSKSGLVLALDTANPKGFDDDENLITDSEFAYSQLSGNTTATANQLFVPYRRNTAVNFVNNGGSGDTYIYQNFNTSFTSGTQYVISIFSNSSTLVLGQGGLASGNFTQISSGSITLSNGWYRHWVSYSATVNNPNITPQVVVAQGINVTLCGWQLELGSSVTDYTRTTGTVKNRGTTLIDLSGNGNTGTLINGPTYSSSNRGFLVLDGTDDYIRISSASYLNSLGSSDFTVSMWIYRATNPPGGNGEMLYQSATLDNGFLIGISDVSFRIELRDNQSTNGTLGGVSNIFTAGIWNNVVLTKQGTTYTGYSQGVSKGTFTSYQDVGTNSGFVDIGRVDWWGPSHWEGNIAQVSVYSRALSAVEIQQNFNTSRGRFGI